MRKRMILFLVMSFVLSIGAACLAACSSESISFTEGERISLSIGDEHLLQCEVEGSGTVTLTSSAPEIVSVEEKGYIRANDVGTAEITGTTKGGKQATIWVDVTAPAVEEQDFYVGYVVQEKYYSLQICFDRAGGPAEKIYVETQNEQGTLISRKAVAVESHRQVNIPLKDLDIVKDGLYRWGISLIQGDLEVISVSLSDTIAAYSLAGNDGDWTFYNAEVGENGELKIVNESLNHGGAGIVIDVAENEGVAIDSNIRLRVSSGSLWSVKLRRGDGKDDLFEEVVQYDVRAVDVPEVIVDLSKYTNYIRDGKITLVVYAVEGPLLLKDIVYRSGEGCELCAVHKEDVVPLSSVNIRVPSVIEAGKYYTATPELVPENASFRDVWFKAGSGNIEVSKDGIFCLKDYEPATIIAYSADGSVRAEREIRAEILPQDLQIKEGYPDFATVDASRGTFDLAERVKILPEDSTRKEIVYTILDSTCRNTSIGGDGIVRFDGAGEIRIRMALQSLPIVSQEFVLTVKNGYVNASSVQISNSGQGGALRTGETLQLSASVQPRNATDGGVLWSTSDPTIATVDEQGVVTAAGGGTVIVYACAEDGTCYDSIAVTCAVLGKYEIDASADYLAVYIDGDVQGGDVAELEIREGEEIVISLLYTVPVAEQEASAAGSMDAQKRILITLGEDFSVSGEYTFSLKVYRNGTEINGYLIRSVTPIKSVLDCKDMEWEDGYRGTVTEGTAGVGVTIGEEYGNIGAVIEKEEIADAKYLCVRAIEGASVEKIAIKVRFGENEFDLGTGDMTSRGVWLFTLSEPPIVDYLAKYDRFELLLYGIGNAGETAVFENVFFAK